MEDRFACGDGALIIAIDFPISFLHPTTHVGRRWILRMPSFPIVIAITLRRIERQIVERRRDAEVDPVFIHIEAHRKRLAVRNGGLRAMDVAAIVAARNDVQGDAVRRPRVRAGIRDRPQHLVQMLRPTQRIGVIVIVSADIRIASGAIRAGEARRRFGQDLVIRVDRLDGVIDFAEAERVI